MLSETLPHRQGQILETPQRESFRGPKHHQRLLLRKHTRAPMHTHKHRSTRVRTSSHVRNPLEIHKLTHTLAPTCLRGRGFARHSKWGKKENKQRKQRAQYLKAAKRQSGAPLHVVSCHDSKRHKPKKEEYRYSKYEDA